MNYGGIFMPCSCGFSTEYPECNGTHKIVKEIKDKLISEIESIDISDGKLNALGMKMIVIETIKKMKGQ
jgi:hypothetical protein